MARRHHANYLSPPVYLRNLWQKSIQASADTLETTRWPWPHFPRKTYDNLVRYTKYASGAYQVLCPRPMGNSLVAQFTDLVTSTQGFIARDDKRRELVVALRGTTDITSILVGQTVLDELRPQIQAHPSYSVMVCGHSLGGSIASIASIAIQPHLPWELHQPIHFRCTLNCATEYWEFTELGAPKNVKRCDGGEDPNGSASIPSSGVNPAHWVYFRQPIASDPTVCIIDHLRLDVGLQLRITKSQRDAQQLSMWDGRPTPSLSIVIVSEAFCNRSQLTQLLPVVNHVTEAALHLEVSAWSCGAEADAWESTLNQTNFGTVNQPFVGTCYVFHRFTNRFGVYRAYLFPKDPHTCVPPNWTSRDENRKPEIIESPRRELGPTMFVVEIRGQLQMLEPPTHSELEESNIGV
ncbi:Alpha/Beta hydrolase protein [Melanogaster broomeanus]|nr:Alpha/Beta hydrolase protein [Melanogaster broomeanus]